MWKFKVVRNEIYEDTGNPRKDRLAAKVTPSGALLPGPGLGDETEEMYNAVPEELIDEAGAYWNTEGEAYDNQE